MRDSDHAFTSIGEGNVSSIEFNLLYRWHSTLSKEDEKWFDANMSKGCGGKPSEVSSTKSLPIEYFPSAFVPSLHQESLQMLLVR